MGMSVLKLSVDVAGVAEYPGAAEMPTIRWFNAINQSSQRWTSVPPFLFVRVLPFTRIRCREPKVKHPYIFIGG